MVVALTFSALAGSFADVSSDHWAYDAVNKLVAADLIEGYPDGTFGGQRNLTRYEISKIVARLLDDIQAEREELETDVVYNSNNLSVNEAKAVEAIVEKLMERNMPDNTQLSDSQIEEVVQVVKALSYEFKYDLEELGVEAEDIVGDLDDVEARVAALEDAQDSVSFGGEYSVDFENVAIDPDVNATFSPFSYSADDDVLSTSKKFQHTLDLDVDVNKDPLAASLDLSLTKEGLGFGDSNGFDLESLEGTLTGPEFTATIKEGIEKGFRPYLFDGEYNDDDEWQNAVVDGVLVEAGENTYLLHGVDFDDDITGDGENDHGYAFGAHDKVNALGGFDMYYGLANIFGETSFTETDDEIDLATVVGAKKTFDVSDFSITPEVAVSDLDVGDYYFTVNAEGELSLVKVTFNAKSIDPNFEPIMFNTEAFSWQKGFDVKGEMTLAEKFDLAAYYESYNTTDYGFDYVDDAAVPFTELTAKVTEDNAFDLSGVDVFGDAAYRNYNDIDDAVSKVFNLTAKKSVSDFDLTGKLEWEETDSEFLVQDGEDDTTEIDKFDKSLDVKYTGMEDLTAGAFYKIDQDNEIVEHKYNAEYTKDIFVAGAEIMVEAEEQKLYATANADKEESYSYFDTDFTPYAEFTTWLEAETTNLLAGLEAERTLSEYATADGGYEFGDNEQDESGDDNAYYGNGSYNRYWAGVSYSITDDVEATADAEHINFNGDEGITDYEAEKVTAGVSVAF